MSPENAGRYRNPQASKSRPTFRPSPAPSPSNNGFESERLWGPYNDWEPAIAIGRTNGDVYQLTTDTTAPNLASAAPGPTSSFVVQVDGGETWEADQFLTPFRKSHNDPQIEVAGNGTIYAAWLNDYVPGVKFVKSADSGSSWTAPIAITAKSTKPNWSDKPVLAVSADGRTFISPSMRAILMSRPPTIWRYPLSSGQDQQRQALLVPHRGCRCA